MQKKIRICLLAVAAAILSASVLLSAGLFSASAENPDASGRSADTSIDSNALITYGYLQSMLDSWKQELLQELANSGSGGTVVVESPYQDITLPKGTIVLLDGTSEAIFRGGDAIVITVSSETGKGLTDLSAGRECFSGEKLQFGHIYYKTNAQSRTYILILGEQAAFTMKGTYEIR